MFSIALWPQAANVVALMKLTSITSALVAALALALSCSSVRAQTNTNTMAAPATNMSSSSSSSTMTTSMSMKKTPYKGTITAIDMTGNSVTVHGAKGDMMLMVTPTTKFKGASALSDFAVGDKVTGSFMKDASGSMMAASMHKKAAK